MYIYAYEKGVVIVKCNVFSDVCVFSTVGPIIKLCAGAGVMMSFIVLSETKTSLSPYTCLGSVLSTTEKR